MYHSLFDITLRLFDFLAFRPKSLQFDPIEELKISSFNSTQTERLKRKHEIDQGEGRRRKGRSRYLICICMCMYLYRVDCTSSHLWDVGDNLPCNRIESNQVWVHFSSLHFTSLKIERTNWGLKHCRLNRFFRTPIKTNQTAPQTASPNHHDCMYPSSCAHISLFDLCRAISTLLVNHLFPNTQLLLLTLSYSHLSHILRAHPPTRTWSTNPFELLP